MTVETDRPTNKPRRRLRRLVIGLASTAVLALVVYLTIHHLTDPERVRRLAEEHIQRIVGSDVHIGRAEFSLVDGLRLYDVRIDADRTAAPNAGRDSLPNATNRPAIDKQEMASTHAPAFSCRLVELRHRPWYLLLGQLRIQLLSAIEPSCTIVHDGATGKTNVAKLIQRLMERAAQNVRPTSLPVIELRDARVRVMARRASGTRQIEDLRLTVRGKPALHDPQLYDIFWHSADPSTSGGYSQLDLHTGYIRNVHGGLPSMSIEAVMLAINARYDGVGAWNSLLGLGGRVRARDYNLIGTPDHPGSRSATIDLKDATISIPINEYEEGLPRTERYLRFSRVNGTVVATTKALRADFRGTLRGAQCDVHAVLRGYSDELRSLEDVGFDVRVSIKNYSIPRDDASAPPEEVRFVRQFPRLAANIHAFDPHGHVDLDVHITKQPGPAEPVTLARALITLRGADTSVHRFPYRGNNLSGEIEITPNGISVRGIRGEHDGAVINVEGWLASSNHCSPANYTIVARNVPIDDALFGALKPHARATAESFAARGRVNISVELHRAACVGDATEGKWSSVVDIELTGNVSACYAHFPYRLDHLTGHVIVEPGRTKVVDVKGAPVGAGDETVRVDGTINSLDHHLDSIDLIVRGAGLAINKALLDALPSASRARLQAFRPTGRVDVTTRVHLDPETGALAYESDVRLDHAAVNHVEFPLPVTDITGALHVAGDRVSTTELAGRYGDTGLTIAGSIELNNPTKTAALLVSCTGLTWDDTTRALLPDAWKQRLSSWIMDTPFDVDLEVRAAPGVDPHVDVKGVVRFAHAVIRRANSPLRLEDVRGEVAFDRAGARGLGITGKLGVASVQLSFEQRGTSSDAGGVVSLTASSLPLNDDTRRLLPKAYQAAWDRLKPEGTVDLFVDEFSFGPEPEMDTEQGVCKLRGRLALHDVSLRSSASPKHMTGEMTIAGTLLDRLGGTLLSGKVTLAHAKLFDRDIENIDASWSLVRAEDGQGRFEIKKLQGRLYGGSVAGDLELNTGPKGSTYHLSTTIQNSALNPLVNAGQSFVDDNGAPADVRGRVDAHVFLSGQWEDRTSRRGGGEFLISEGRIYKLPLMAAILHVLNVTLPDRDAPQSAAASFYVVGDRVELNRIVLRSPALELVGSGTMSLPDFAVDFELANVNPRPWARIPVITDFVEGASRELVGLRVTGPLARPTVRTQPLGGLSDEFKRLFRKRPPQPIRPTGS